MTNVILTVVVSTLTLAGTNIFMVVDRVTMQVDSTQRFTVVTRFVTVDGTDNGNLKEIQRFYIQKDRTIQQPTFNGFNGLSDAYCSTFR
jgi:hypothetical protein